MNLEQLNEVCNPLGYYFKELTKGEKFNSPKESDYNYGFYKLTEGELKRKSYLESLPDYSGLGYILQQVMEDDRVKASRQAVRTKQMEIARVLGLQMNSNY